MEQSKGILIFQRDRAQRSVRGQPLPRMETMAAADRAVEEVQASLVMAATAVMAIATVPHARVELVAWQWLPLRSRRGVDATEP